MKYFILFLIPLLGHAKIADQSTAQYSSYWGTCPTKSAGKISLLLSREFDKKKSLKDVKELILKDKLEDKYFISDYKIQYNPLINKLTFQFECPEPVMKVNIYKDSSMNYYTAILGDNGKLYDPSFEVLLRAEGLLKGELSHMAVPMDAIESADSSSIIKTVKQLNNFIRERLSEVILNNKGELTVILSINGQTATTFMGNEEWKLKFKKLTKIVKYFEDRQKVPTLLNLTNVKKIVVKFSPAN